MNVIKGAVVAPNARVAIVIARFNYFINQILLDSAVDVLKRIGQVRDEHITVVWVPGAYELPLSARVLADSKKYNAIIALGTVLRGETSHFECIARACSSGLSTVAIQTKLPVVFGVLTVDSIEQAIARSGAKTGNKGVEAAFTALEMINVLKDIQE